MKNNHSKKRKDEKLKLSLHDVHLLILLLDGGPTAPYSLKEASDIKERLHVYFKRNCIAFH